MQSKAPSTDWLSRLAKNWFLAALVGSLIAAKFFSDLVPVAITSGPTKSWLVASVMFAMSLTFDISDLRKLGSRGSHRTWLAIAIACLVSIAVLPLAAFGCGLVLREQLGAALGNGLIVAAVVPSTLASSAVWTRRGGGNDVISIIVTLLTNLGCFVIAPFWIWMLLGQSTKIDGAQLSMNLLFVVVIPAIFAQLLRLPISVRQFIQRLKPGLNSFCQVGVLAMVFLSTAQLNSETSASSRGSSWLPIGIAIAAITALHLVAMWFAWKIANSAGVQRRDRIAVSIAGSQKTLMVGLKLATDCGVSILPIVAFHTIQLIVDTVIVDWWKRHECGEQADSETDTATKSD